MQLRRFSIPYSKQFNFFLRHFFKLWDFTGMLLQVISHKYQLWLWTSEFLGSVTTKYYQNINGSASSNTMYFTFHHSDNKPHLDHDNGI